MEEIGKSREERSWTFPVREQRVQRQADGTPVLQLGKGHCPLWALTVLCCWPEEHLEGV